MACDIQSVADDSKCFLCVSEKHLMAAQAYAAWQAWQAVDGTAPATLQELLTDSSELMGKATHKQLLAALAYALCNLNSP